jgi:hypothetical protein
VELPMPGGSVQRRRVAQTAADARLVVLMSIGPHHTRMTERSIDPDACAVKRKDWAERIPPQPL